MNLVDIYRIYIRLKARLFTLGIRSGFASVGDGTIIVPPLRVGGEQAISIGGKVYIGSNCWLHVLGDALQTPSHPAIVIGNRVAFAGYCTVTAAQSVVIEDSVLIARYVYISDHSHEYRDRVKPVLDQGIAQVAPVRIREGAWLGQSVVVCPGVTIGRNSVVGANSVVLNDVPDHCIAVGSPARVVRKI